ncbi:MAG: AraC family transcriptional regulator [Saonia sp.]
MELNTIEPPIKIKKYVKYFWHSRLDISRQRFSTYKILADVSPGIIFHHDNGNSTIFEENGVQLPNVFIYGPGTKPCHNIEKGNSFLFGICFQPTALKTLLGIDADLIQNCLIRLDDILSYNLADELLNTTNPESVREIFTTLINGKLLKNRNEDLLIDKSIELIDRNTRSANIDTLSKNLNISKRQYQRRFKHFVGLCPAKYIRIVKFQKSLQLLRSNEYHKLSDIAYYLGYADQSHFIKEFKLFSGFRPKDLSGSNSNVSRSEKLGYKPNFLTNRIILS